jgi:thermitase
VAQQYSLYNTNAFAGWEYGTGDANLTTVVVIDTGVDLTHPDLIAKRVAGKSRVFDSATGADLGADDPPTIGNGLCHHGTQVGSVAAASTNNGAGIAGVCWGCKIVSLRVFTTADNCLGTSDAAMAAAVNYVRTTLVGDPLLGKLVVNISIGDPQIGATCNGDTPLTRAAMAALVGAPNNVPIFIAAGNNGAGVEPPASCAGIAAAAGIIPVGATDASNLVTNFSSNGPELAAHGVVAPGHQMLMDTPGGGTANNSGTSFSSPFAAGLAALMLSARPTLTPALIESYIRGGAVGIGGLSAQGEKSGAGQVNVFRSMRLAVNGTLAGFDGDEKAIAFPNPFKVSANPVVSFSVPVSLQSANTQIRVYTVSGQLVRELKGLTWDGKNNAGTLVASGTYVFEVKTDAGQTTGRLAVVR